MNAFDRLAERCGIQNTFEDAFGHEHTVSTETKQLVLRAMHLAAGSESEAEDRLQQLDAQDWSPLLPVHVAYRTGDPILVPVVRKKHTQTLHWTVTCEGGRELKGSVEFEKLALLADRVDDSQATWQRRLLPLDSDLPWGYHSLRLGGSEEACSLVVTPGKCWLPPEALEGQQLWGFAAQLYVLRSAGNWGMGDFGDLARLAESSRKYGAGVLGVNPLHALFLDQPEEASPYSPSDRLLLNPLYIDLTQLPEMDSSEEAQRTIAAPEFREQLAAARASGNVNYAAVTSLKLPILRMLFAEFEVRNDEQRLGALKAFHAERKPLLDRACLFQALRAYFTEQSPDATDCSQWPHGFSSATSPEVEAFAKEHAEQIRFQLWMQWVADEQLQAAKSALGPMPIGLYRDLAVGGSGSGAEVWSFPGALASGASIGAPPDLWNPAGQDWGLPPLDPIGTRRLGYANFIQLLQANMRHAGALRIDHALALKRLYWIPSGEAPENGAYVENPIEDLIGILALESHRNHCMVVGEDLGSVPPGFRDRMTEANILSYRLLLLEKDNDAFVSSAKYLKLSLSVASSHDLPTLGGWWNASDIDKKEELGLFPGEDKASEARATRAKDHQELIQLLQSEGMLHADEEPTLESFIDAVHRFLRATPSLMTLVQLDDLTGEEMQVNIPASPGQHANWRRKLSLSLEELESSGTLKRIAALMLKTESAAT